MIFHAFTKARRAPMYLGKVAGRVLPFTVTVAQACLIVGPFLVLLRTWRLWATPSGPLNVVILLGLPAGLAFASRYLRIEGRSAGAAILGYVGYFTRPKYGEFKGKPYRPRRRRHRIRTRTKELSS